MSNNSPNTGPVLLPGNSDTADAIVVARQPIFTRTSAVMAYELLFRSGGDNFYSGTDPRLSSAQTLNRALHWIGLDSLVGQHNCFVNFTMEVLQEGLYTLLPPARAVIELLEYTHPDDDAIELCRKIKDAGYSLALDDVTDVQHAGALLDLVDYVKIDFRAVPPKRRAEIVRSATSKGRQVIAEKVETKEEFSQAMECGCELVQGYFFCQPEMVVRRGLGGSQLVYMEFLRELNRQPLVFEDIEAIIKRDASLAFRLLRYLNSAAMGVRTKVTSIRQALVLLGEKVVRKWGTLVAMTNINRSKPSELMVTSLVRAQFCERAAKLAGLRDFETDAFLIGLLSLFDAMLDTPMEDVLSETATSDAVRHVLLGDSRAQKDLSRILALAKACERGAWTAATEATAGLRLTQSEVAVAYYESLTWADQTLLMAA